MNSNRSLMSPVMYDVTVKVKTESYDNEPIHVDNSLEIKKEPEKDFGPAIFETDLDLKVEIKETWFNRTVPFLSEANGELADNETLIANTTNYVNSLKEVTKHVSCVKEVANHINPVKEVANHVNSLKEVMNHVNSAMEVDDCVNSMTDRTRWDTLMRNKCNNKLKKPGIQACRICEVRCVSRYNLLKHNLQHLIVKIIRYALHECDYCKVCYMQKSELIDHIRIKHAVKKKSSRKKTHKCDVCDKVFTYKSWHHHMQTVHGSPRKCGKCEKTFKSVVYLRKHDKYVHQGENKPIWRFRSVHKDSAVRCAQCSKVFEHPYSLKTHLRNVHPVGGTKECDLCGSILKSSINLRVHKQRVHYNDGKKHTCDLCGKIFKSPRYLRVHFKNSHDK